MFTPIKPIDKWNIFHYGHAITKRLIFAACVQCERGRQRNNGHGQIELNSKCFNVNLSNDIDIAWKCLTVQMKWLSLTVVHHTKHTYMRTHKLTQMLFAERSRMRRIAYHFINICQNVVHISLKHIKFISLLNWEQQQQQSYFITILIIFEALQFTFIGWCFISSFWVIFCNLQWYSLKQMGFPVEQLKRTSNFGLV